nr:MAG TPA: hypothetical protein [Caudoviricetes sp.]
MRQLYTNVLPSFFFFSYYKEYKIYEAKKYAFY